MKKISDTSAQFIFLSLSPIAAMQEVRICYVFSHTQSTQHKHAVNSNLSFYFCVFCFCKIRFNVQNSSENLIRWCFLTFKKYKSCLFQVVVHIMVNYLLLLKLFRFNKLNNSLMHRITANESEFFMAIK